MAADTTSLHLRLPKGLYKRLQRQARRNNVSLNTEIVNRLGKSEYHLQKSEAVLAIHVAEIMKPLVENAIESALLRADTHRLAGLDLILDLIDPRTEAEILERLRHLGVAEDIIGAAVGMFRGRQAAKEPDEK